MIVGVIDRTSGGPIDIKLIVTYFVCAHATNYMCIDTEIYTDTHCIQIYTDTHVYTCT